MDRKTTLRAALVGLPLAAALVYVALNWYTVEEESVWVDAGPLARADAFLAYERLLTRSGAQVHVATSPSQLDALPRGGALVLAGRRLAYMTPARVGHIVSWVDGGGILVVEAERRGIDDPLLDALGIERTFPQRRRGERMVPEPPASVAVQRSPTFDWPGESKRLTVALGSGRNGLRDQRVRSDATVVRQGDRVVMMSFAEGEGRVTIVPRLDFLDNSVIGKLVHARFGWRLVSPDGTTARIVTLFTKMESPPFLDWVARDAWAVALAAALLVAAWLARIVPRFGPLAPEPPPVRRSLLEHIVSSGRYLWSRGERDYLAGALRERLWRGAARRGLARGGGTPQSIPALARIAAMPEPELRRALTAGIIAPQVFVDTAKTIQEAETRLVSRERRR